MIIDIFNVIVSLPSQHIIYGIISTAICISVTWFYNKSTKKIKSIILQVVSYLVIVNECIFQFYMVYYDIWSISTSLPFEMCYLSALLIPIYIKNQNCRLLKTWFFFAGFGGSIFAFINTNLSELEHFFVSIHYFFAHGIVIFVMFSIVIDGYLPKWADYFNAVKWTTLLIIIIIFINLLFGSNYMFTFEKPEGTNFTTLMPGWPYYFLIMLFIGLCCYTIMMLIVQFIRNNKRS